MMGKYNLFRGRFKEEKVRLMQGFTGLFLMDQAAPMDGKRVFLYF